MASNMPQFDLDQVKSILTEEEFALFQLTLNKSQLRATPPNEKKAGSLGLVGESYYVWRYLAFYLAGFPPHTSIPMVADYKFDRLSWLRHPDEEVRNQGRATHKAKLAELDTLIEKVVNCQPARNQKGVLLWGKALGYF